MTIRRTGECASVARRLLLLALAGGTSSLCGVGCAARPLETEPVASSDEGTLRNAALLGGGPLDAIGKLNMRFGACTATVVAPGIALTAAHCVADAIGMDIAHGCGGPLGAWVRPRTPLSFEATDANGTSRQSWGVTAVNVMPDAYPSVVVNGAAVCPVTARGAQCAADIFSCGRLSDPSCATPSRAQPQPVSTTMWYLSNANVTRDLALVALDPMPVTTASGSSPYPRVAGSALSEVRETVRVLVAPSRRGIARYFVSDPSAGGVEALLPLRVTEAGYGVGSRNKRGVGTTVWTEAAGANTISADPGAGRRHANGADTSYDTTCAPAPIRASAANSRSMIMRPAGPLDTAANAASGIAFGQDGWRASGADASTDVWTGPGDSGGPTIIGAIPLPTPVPGPVIGAPTPVSALGTTPFVVAGVHSRGSDPASDPNNLGPDAGIRDISGAPTSHSSATYAPAVSDWLIATLPDSDGDGVPDVTDRFSGVDDLGTDSDSDGTPDVADLCPCDPTERNPWTDGDKDGVCGYCSPSLKDPRAATNDLCANTCKAQAPDNCPSVANPDQKNANRPSEIVNNAVELGDACEPVPVPLMRPASFTAAAKRLTGSTFERTPITTSESFVNTLTVELMPPRDAMGVARPVTVPTTQLRYCRTNLALGVSNICFSNGSDAIGDRYLDRDTRGNVVTTRAAETANTWWHRMTTSAGAAPGSPIGARTYGNAAANTSTTTDMPWNWQADFAYWVTRGYGAGFFAPSAVVGKNPGVPANVPDVPEDGQYGRLWSHADTRVGMAGSWSIDVAGYHAQKNSVNPAQELANGYATLQPYVRTSEIGQPKLWAIDWTFPVYSCAPIDCPSFTQPSLDNCPMCGVTNRLPTTSAPIFSGLAAGSALRGVSGGPNGSGLDALAQLPGGGVVSGEAGSSLAVSLSRSPSLVQAFATGVRWVGEHDPIPQAGVGMLMPTALAIRGGAIEEAAFVSGSRLVSATDLIADANANAAARAVAERVLAASEMPSVRTNAEFVYHRATGRLYVVGGTLANGREAGDVLAFDLRTGAWTTISARIPLGAVRAATVGADGTALWVAQERGATASLSRLDLATGLETPITSGAARRSFAKVWLRADGSTGVIVAASSTSRAEAFRVSASGIANPVVTKLGSVSGGIDAPPVVEDGTVRLLRRDPASSAPATTRVPMRGGTRSTTAALAALL